MSDPSKYLKAEKEFKESGDYKNALQHLTTKGIPERTADFLLTEMFAIGFGKAKEIYKR